MQGPNSARANVSAFQRLFDVCQKIITYEVEHRHPAQGAQQQQQQQQSRPTGEDERINLPVTRR